MDFRRQANRPAPRAVQQAQAAPAAAPQQTNGDVTMQPHTTTNGNSPAGKKRFLVLALATLLLLSIGFGLGKFLPIFQGEYGRVDTSKHQAVFLTNDQVYFGKITAIDDDVLVIENIYYLQKGAEQSGDNKEAAAPTQQSNMSLAKLGSELHAPQDRMQINKDQVLFWENLKDDGKVSKAIKEYDNKK